MHAQNATNLVEVQGLPAIRCIEGLKETLGGAGEHLGDLVWWTLSDADTDRATLLSAWTGAGLPAELLPEPPTAEKALKTAVRSCQVGMGDVLLRPSKDDEREVIYAVVREQRLGDGSLAHAQEARVILDRAREQVSSDAPDHPLVLAISGAFRALRHTHTVDDIRRGVVKALRSFAAVTLREGGGVYWVPRSYASQTRKLERAIGQLGSSRFHVLPVHHTAAGAATLGVAARGSLEAELSALKAELEAFRSQPPERASTLERRLEAFSALRERGQLYRDVLEVQVEDLEAELTAMAEVVNGLIAATPHA